MLPWRWNPRNGYQSWSRAFSPWSHAPYVGLCQSSQKIPSAPSLSLQPHPQPITEFWSIGNIKNIWRKHTSPLVLLRVHPFRPRRIAFRWVQSLCSSVWVAQIQFQRLSIERVGYDDIGVFNPKQVNGGAHRNPTPVTCHIRNGVLDQDRKMGL